MTLAVRNSILIAGAILTGALVLAYAASGYTLLFGAYANEPFRVGEYQTWFGLQWSVRPLAAYRSLAAAGILGLIATFGVALSVRLFRRVSSAEIYFMTAFLISLAAELVRIGQPLVDIAGVPPYVGVVLSRIVLFWRLFGSLALFSAGIYSAGADYPRIGSVTLLLAALSFLIVYFVPVDSREISATFVHVTGDREAIDLMLGFLSLGTIVNYVIGWSRGHRERGGTIALAAAALVVGSQLVLHVPAIVALSVGLALVAAGTASFLLVNRSYYLWY
ncbi:MAG: hypothetical protein ACOCWX_01165 [Spirochaetota bacterium]